MTLEEERLSALRNRRLGDLEARAAALRNPDLSASDRNDQQFMYDQLKGYLAPDVSLIDQFKNSSLGRYFNTPSKNVSNEDAYNKTNAGRIAFINAADANVKPISPAAPSQAAPAGLQPGSVIPRALQGSGPSASLAAPSQGTAMSYLKKYEDMMNKAPNMAAMNEYAQQRGRQGSSAMLNSLLANSAGENFAPQQAAYLKQAMAARDPLEVSGGILTNKGFVEDPYAARKAAAEVALKIGTQLNESEQSALRQGSIDARAVDRVTDLFGRAASTAAGKAAGTAAQNQPMVQANFNAVMDSLNAFDSPEVKNEAGYALGLVGSRVGSIPGLNSNFLNRREQLQGQAFLQAFEALKGGGAISEVEGEKATIAIARLQRATTEKDFYDALADVKKVFSNAYAARSKMAAAGANAVPQLGGGPSSQTGGISESNAAPAVQEFGAPPPGAVRPKVKQ